MILMSTGDYMTLSLSEDSISGTIIHSSVSPNPTNGSVIIKFNDLEPSDVTLSISDLSGNPIVSNYGISGNMFDISAYREGWYIFTLKFDNIIEKHKILKQR